MGVICSSGSRDTVKLCKNARRWQMIGPQPHHCQKVLLFGVKVVIRKGIGGDVMGGIVGVPFGRVRGRRWGDEWSHCNGGGTKFTF